MSRVLKIYSRLFVFSLPIFFMPLMLDPYGAGKNWWLGATGLLGLAVWIGDLIWRKRNEIVINKVIIWLGAATVWAVINWWRQAPGVRMNSVMVPMGLATLAGLLIWVFLWSQTADEEERKVQWNWLTAGAGVVALSSLVSFLLPTNMLPWSWPKDNPVISIGNGWSLTGSIFGELILMAVVASEWIKRLYAKLKNNQDYIWDGVVAAVVMLIIFLDVYKIYKLGWVTLDGTSAWMIAVETLKRSPIWGVGIGNYVEAFNMFKPASFNMTRMWGNVFGTANMGILQIWTEMGIGGLLLAIAGGWSILKEKKKSWDYWRLAAMLLVLAFLPLNLIGVMLAGWLAAGMMSKRTIKLSLNVGENKINIAPYMVAVVILGLVGFGGWWWGRIILGEVQMRQSLVMAAKNDGTGTYNYQIQAISNNPYSAEYRRLYSQTNMALAGSLLQKKEATDEEKQKASVLIQQAVREAKAAIALDGANSGYWSNLASIYKSLIGLIEGSADWSLQAYQQAAAYDPANPMLKLDMGGLLFAAGNYEQADRVFEEVVNNKPDFANGWYNWAYNAKKMNRLGDAVQRLTQAVSLVPVDSGDYDKAAKELGEWRKEYEAAVAAAKIAQEAAEQPKSPETLTEPQALPTISQEDKVNVSEEDLAPPVVATPMPTMAPASSPTP